MGRLSDWRPYSKYVQSGMTDGQYLNASFTMLAAGPPRLASFGGLSKYTGGTPASPVEGADNIVFPIGVVQNFNLSHNRQFNRIFEVGSERSFWISGRTMGQIGLSRVMYHGPSLLRVLYAYYEDLAPPTTFPSLFGEGSMGSLGNLNIHNVKIPAGYENLFINLASDLFAQPVGMLMYFRDSNEETVGSVYLESCVVPNHTIASDANGTIVQENSALQFERAIPIKMNPLELVDISAADDELALPATG